jgi:hypothetical protein
MSATPSDTRDRDGDWSRALALFGLLGSIAVLTVDLRSLAAATIWHVRIDAPIVLNGWNYAATGLGAGAVIAALAGRRRTAAVLAWLSTGARIAGLVVVTAHYEINPAFGGWPIALSLIVAAALSLPGRPAVAEIGRRGLTVWAGACAIAIASAVADAAVPRVVPFDGGYAWAALPPAVDRTIRAVAVLIGLAALAPLGVRVLMRIAVLSAPIVAIALMTDAGYVDHRYPVQATSALGWGLLVCVPLLVLGLGTAALYLIDKAAGRISPSRTTASR